MKSSNSIGSVDLQLLELLQQDASLSNQALAERVRISAPTCLRRIKRLHEAGLIERTIAVLSPEKLSAAIGFGLTAVVEITLDRQDAQSLEQFEDRVASDPAVQQCYRVSPGPDFVLIVHAANMPAYQAMTQRLFTSDSNVRNTKAFFSIKRSKFGAELPLTVGASS
ncbi:MAG: Lrp/AsnC family transcriptional regulator [Burkholderiales bacterium]|nr:Lrp/AsnC family transcriptional regulator [Burkholderiales bacterium]